jgi:hypothetical protein
MYMYIYKYMYMYIYKYIYISLDICIICCRFKWKTEAQAIFLNLYGIPVAHRANGSLSFVRLFVCSFVRLLNQTEVIHLQPD